MGSQPKHGRRLWTTFGLLLSKLATMILLLNGSSRSSYFSMATAFQSLPSMRTNHHYHHHQRQHHTFVPIHHIPSIEAAKTKTSSYVVELFAANNNDDDQDPDQDDVQSNDNYYLQQQHQQQQQEQLPSRWWKRLSKRFRKRFVVAAFLGTITAWPTTTTTTSLVPRAEASAPVMALPKQQTRDPAEEVLHEHDRKMQKKWQEEMNARNQRAREIEREHGVAARETFEAEYEAEKAKQAKEKQEGLVKLKRDLLDRGIDPFVDFEGRRQVVLYERGVDLGQVPGTQMHMEKQQEKRNYKKSAAYKMENNRRIVKALVQDMKNRDIDPLEYFENNKERTQAILAMPPLQAAQLVQKYEANLEQYGQVNVPKEGELSALEKMQQKKKSGRKTSQEKEAQKKAREDAKRAKAEERAKVKAEKQKANEAAKAQKEIEKKEKAAAKKAKKAEAKAGAGAAAGAAAAGTAAKSVTDGADSAIDSVTPDRSDDTEIVGQQKSTNIDNGDDYSEEGGGSTSSMASTPVDASRSASKKISIGGKEIGLVPLTAGAAVAVGGGGYAFKMYQERAAATEEERQRQFRLLMGEASGYEKGPNPGSSSALEEMGTNGDDWDDGMDMTLDEDQQKRSKDTEQEPVPASTETPKKKRRMGGFFSKKGKNDRETDLNNLVSSDATAPKFATLLAKVLTYGAPGRFPSVDKLPGKMPFDEFDLETAKEILTEAREEAGITMEESAEIFANVVNCMLIDIVDLASSTLKEKDEKATLDGISVVVDFMNHAASLYDSVAGGVVITPVTYGGSLGKGKLEQMYQAYAASGMMNMANMDTDFDSRVTLLQDVFGIPEKKAEGLAMKAMQKSLMTMMKSGEGMDGMEDMLKNMGGMEGMEGLMEGDKNDMDPEQLKEMLYSLKEMKQSGSIPPEEFESVKAEFKKAFGSSIDEVIKEGEENSSEFSEDREILDLMNFLFD